MRFRAVALQQARRLRRSMTKPEVILWHHLRGDKLGGLRFRRQHPMGAYILDFYCAPAKQCVEVDGLIHGFASVALRDDVRDDWLKSQGVRIPWLAASDVLNEESLVGVMAAIEAAAAPSTA